MSESQDNTSKRTPKVRFGWQAAREAMEYDEIAERLDAIAQTNGMDPDDPRRLALLRDYLTFCDVHEERPEGRILHILTGADLLSGDEDQD